MIQSLQTEDKNNVSDNIFIRQTYMEDTKIIKSIRHLHDVSKAINSSLQPEEVIKIICRETAQLMKSAQVLLLLLSKDKSTLTINHHSGFADDDLPFLEFSGITPFDHCIVHKGKVINLLEVVSPEDQKIINKIMPALFKMVFAPLEIHGEAYGLLGVTGSSDNFTLLELEIFCSLSSQAAMAIENANLYHKLHKTFLHTAEALAEAVNSRDPYTGGHTKRVQGYVLQVAKSINLSDDEKESLQLAAILHDIGKIGIDDVILRKEGKLSVEERRKMKEHPEIGAVILRYVEEMREVIPGVRHHHEWYDGSGYPDGLKAESIPLNARIIAIADAYDALTTDRPYRKASKPEEALELIRSEASSHFDPKLLNIFSDMISTLT